MLILSYNKLHCKLLVERPQLMFQTCTAHTFRLDRWLDTPVDGFTVQIYLWCVCHLSGSVCQNVQHHSLKPAWCVPQAQSKRIDCKTKATGQTTDREWMRWMRCFIWRQTVIYRQNVTQISWQTQRSTDRWSDD